MKWNGAVVLGSLLLVPALAMGTSLTMTDGGIGGLTSKEVPIGVPTQVAIDIVLDVTPNLLGGWDAGLTASKAGLSVAARTANAPFTTWWGLDLGGIALVGSSLDVASAGIGYLEPTGNDAAVPKQVAETITLNVPALAMGESVTISFVDPLPAGFSSVFWTNKAVPATPYDTLGTFTIYTIPEPMSMLLLAAGGLFLRRRSA